MPVRGFRALVAIGVSAATIAMSAAPALAADEADKPDKPVNPTSVAIILPVTIPRTTDSFVSQGATHFGTFFSAETLERYTAPGSPLALGLDAVIDRGATIAIDPLVVASIRRLGSTAPPSAVDWLTRLDAATNDTFTLGFADSDVTAPLQAGREEVLRTGSLDYAIDTSLFAGVPTETPDPDATADPETQLPPLPTSADLTAWDSTLPSVSWPVADTVIGSDLAAIEDSGYATTILSSKNVSRTSRANASATIAGYPVLVTDETISSLLDSTIGAETESSWESSMDALGAAITSYSERGLGTTLALSIDRTQEVPTQWLTRTIDAVDALTEANLVPLHTIASTTPTKAKVIDKPQSTTRIDRVADLLASQALDRQFARIAETPQLITGERRARLLVTLSPAASQRPGGWGASTDEFLRESSDLRASVQLVPSGDILALADRSRLPIYVDNALNQEVTVYVTVSPSLPLVAVDDDRVKFTIKAQSLDKVEIPVQSLSNGDVDLRVSLHTDTDLRVRVGEANQLSMNVRAGWEGPVTIAIGIVVVAFFIFGLVRTIIRRRVALRSER